MAAAFTRGMMEEHTVLLIATRDHLNPSSFILHPSSFILHPSSFISPLRGYQLQPVTAICKPLCSSDDVAGADICKPLCSSDDVAGADICKPLLFI
jgi:hypothetical protein